MHVVFCCDPLNSRNVDPAYEREQDTACSQGCTTSLISYEALVDEGDAPRAVRRVDPSDQPHTGIYRGWMLGPEAYTRPYEALRERGITLINSPTAYRHCHYLPESYEIIVGMTPPTVWIRAADGVPPMNTLLGAVRIIGERPIIVKDYVSSRASTSGRRPVIRSAKGQL